jgi:Ca2+-binding RTX toxin-like protein
MSSIVLDLGNGATIAGENLEYIGLQGEANFIEVKPNGEESGSPVTIVGGGKNDTIRLTAAGSSTVLGLDGDDLLVGSAFSDLIDGGEGNDTLKGGLGADVMKGGAGHDIFEFTNDDLVGKFDQIIDFENEGTDTIKILGVGNEVVSYDSNTGIVSVGEHEAINIGKGLEDLQIGKQEGTDNWEIS